MKKKLILFHIVQLLTVLHIPVAYLIADSSVQKVVTTSEQAVGEVKVLTLSHALAMTLAGNPELEGYSWDTRVMEARVLQSGLLPNPVFNPQLEDFAGSNSFRGFDQAQTTLMLSQLVELGGKRSARNQIASRQKESSELGYQLKRTEILRDTINYFHHVAADQERLELAEDALKLAKVTLQNIKERIRAGRSSEAEGNKAQVLFAQAEIEKEHREHELASAKLRLVNSWGAEEVRFKRVKPELFEQKKTLGYNELLESYEQSPVAKKWIVEKNLRDAELDLAKAGRIPDVTLGVGYRHFHGSEDNTYVAQFSVPIPLFDRNQHQVSEAVAMRERSKSMRRVAELNVKERLFSLYQELQHAELEMTTSRKSIVPKAKQAFLIAKEGFRKGSFSYLELTDTQRIYYDARLNSIQAALEYHEHIGELEKILGRSITETKNAAIKLKD